MHRQSSTAIDYGITKATLRNSCGGDSAAKPSSGSRHQCEGFTRRLDTHEPPVNNSYEATEIPLLIQRALAKGLDTITIQEFAHERDCCSYS